MSNIEILKEYVRETEKFNAKKNKDEIDIQNHILFQNNVIIRLFSNMIFEKEAEKKKEMER